MTDSPRFQGFETARLRIAPTRECDIPALIPIQKACHRYFAFDPGPEEPAEETIRGEMSGRWLPPGGVPERNFHLTLWQNARPVGFAVVYLGFPHDTCAYIGLLFLDEAARGGGLGRELAEGLTEALEPMGISELRIGVSLRNWPGLRFWTGLGFSTVTKVSAPGHYRPEARALIELSAPINTLTRKD